MSGVEPLQIFNSSKPISLPGKKCAYCGCDLRSDNRTRDHAIARRFVPEGTVLNGFNLILPACRGCNDRKAALEDDISLITMLPDTAGRYVRDDERLRRTVVRKARGSISSVTRRLVSRSYNEVKFRCPIGDGASISFEGTAMPLIDEQRAARLAYYHVQAFCFFRSFRRDLQHGAWLEPSDFLMLGYLTKDDWGNPQLRHFMNEIQNWELVGLVAAADGYFRHTMHRRLDGNLWAWAVEWNERMRVFGVYGAQAARNEFLERMPAIRPDLGYGDTTNGFFMRWETALPDEDDVLFDAPAEALQREFARPHWR
ncbi:MAG TPA: hypothetical protein VFW19_16085 [Allosphingosinicella sp.]|nr:hypothetical protein [Allosphingosinicella sp.]